MSLGARIVEGFLHLNGRLPLGYHRWWGRRLSWVCHSLLGYREDVVMVNLSRCFPEKKYDELKAICKRFYIHFATVLTESIWFGACRGPRGRERLHRARLVEIVHQKEFLDLYKRCPQIMVLQAHSGNWEIFGGIGQYGYDGPMEVDVSAMAVTYHRLSSPLWESVMAHNRPAPVLDQGFHGYVDSGHILRFVLENKQKRFLYNFITDQYPYAEGSSEITFMGQPTKVMTAGARLASKLNMAVVYLRYRCREEGGYTWEFIPITEHAREMEPLDIMKRYFELLEEDLREQPWNYLWTHKRWK